jgi:Cu+-exporting ATPase
MILKRDRLLIRNQELIPVDGILISEKPPSIIVFTGEAVPITKNSGDKVFAGGKQIGKVIEKCCFLFLKVTSPNYGVMMFQKTVAQRHKSITDTISRYFTPVLLLIAFLWHLVIDFIDTNTAFNVLRQSVMVCPCALVTAPFTMVCLAYRW